MDRRLAKLPKVPREYIYDTAWGHAMFRAKYTKVVRQRTKALRHFSKPPHWVWSKLRSKRFYFDIKQEKQNAID